MPRVIGVTDGGRRLGKLASPGRDCLHRARGNHEQASQGVGGGVWGKEAGRRMHQHRAHLHPALVAAGQLRHFRIDHSPAAGARCRIKSRRLTWALIPLPTRSPNIPSTAAVARGSDATSPPLTWNRIESDSASTRSTARTGPAPPARGTESTAAQSTTGTTVPFSWRTTPAHPSGRARKPVHESPASPRTI